MPKGKGAPDIRHLCACLSLWTKEAHRSRLEGSARLLAGCLFHVLGVSSVTDLSEGVSHHLGEELGRGEANSTDDNTWGPSVASSSP